MKKLLQLLVSGWLLYGVVRLCILLNPLIFWVAGQVPGGCPFDPCEPMDVLALWLSVCVVAAGIAVMVWLIKVGVKELFHADTDE